MGADKRNEATFKVIFECLWAQDLSGSDKVHTDGVRFKTDNRNSLHLHRMYQI